MLIDADLGARVAGGREPSAAGRCRSSVITTRSTRWRRSRSRRKPGFSDDVIRTGLAGFSGVKRRFQLTGTWNGVQIYDDYGHHPAEIAAVLQAARAGARGRVIAVVEPHRYTRVRDLFRDFTTCFTAADNVIVAPMYSAGESPIDGIDQQVLAEGIRAAGHPAVALIDDPRELVGLIRRHGRPNDMVILLGAGNSTEWAAALPEWLAQAEPRAAPGARCELSGPHGRG